MLRYSKEGITVPVVLYGCGSTLSEYGDRNEMRIYYKDVDSFKWLSER